FTVVPIVYGAAYLHGLSTARLNVTGVTLPTVPRTTTGPTVLPSVTTVCAVPFASVLVDDALSEAVPDITFQLTVAPTSGTSPASSTTKLKGMGRTVPAGA